MPFPNISAPNRLPGTAHSTRDTRCHSSRHLARPTPLLSLPPTQPAFQSHVIHNRPRYTEGVIVAPDAPRYACLNSCFTPCSTLEPSSCPFCPLHAPNAISSKLPLWDSPASSLVFSQDAPTSRKPPPPPPTLASPATPSTPTPPPKLSLLNSPGASMKPRFPRSGIRPRPADYRPDQFTQSPKRCLQPAVTATSTVNLGSRQ
jgi:hypothetical protein